MTEEMEGSAFLRSSEDGTLFNSVSDVSSFISVRGSFAKLKN